MTRNTTDRYILNACVCLINLVRVSHVFFYNLPNLFGSIIYSFAFRWKTRIGHHFCPFPHLTRSHTCARARTQGYFYNRFLHALFAVYVALIFMAVKGERVIATAKQPVDFIACVRFLLRLSRSQTKHLMHYSMLHLLTEKSQIIPFRANQVLLESNKEES